MSRVEKPGEDGGGFQRWRACNVGVMFICLLSGHRGVKRRALVVYFPYLVRNEVEERGEGDGGKKAPDEKRETSFEVNVVAWLPPPFPPRRSSVYVKCGKAITSTNVPPQLFSSWTDEKPAWILQTFFSH